MCACCIFKGSFIVEKHVFKFCIKASWYAKYDFISEFSWQQITLKLFIKMIPECFEYLWALFYNHWCLPSQTFSVLLKIRSLEVVNPSTKVIHMNLSQGFIMLELIRSFRKNSPKKISEENFIFKHKSAFMTFHVIFHLINNLSLYIGGITLKFW